MYRQEAPRSLIFVAPPEQAVVLSISPENGAPAGVEKPAPPQAVVPAAVVYLSESPVGQVVVVVLDVDVVVDVDELVLDEDEVELDVDVLVLDDVDDVVTGALVDVDVLVLDVVTGALVDVAVLVLDVRDGALVAEVRLAVAAAADALPAPAVR